MLDQYENRVSGTQCLSLLWVTFFLIKGVISVLEHRARRTRTQLTVGSAHSRPGARGAAPARAWRVPVQPALARASRLCVWAAGAGARATPRTRARALSQVTEY